MDVEKNLVKISMEKEFEIDKSCDKLKFYCSITNSNKVRTIKPLLYVYVYVVY